MKTLDLRHSGVFIEVGACDDPHMRLVLAALGAALGAFSIGLAIQEPDALTLPAPVHVAIGWSFVVAGSIAWRQRPENRMGLLMTLAGIVWFGRDLDWLDSSLAGHASELSLNVFLALVAHQLIVFPSGFARSRAERLLVTAVYALAVLGYVPSELSDTVNALLSVVGIALTVAVVYVIVRRWREADGAERRALRPVVFLGPPVMVVAAAALAHDYVGVDLSPTGEELLRWCAVAYAALPVAILGRLLAGLGDGTVYDDAVLEKAAVEARRALRGQARRLAWRS